MAQILFGTIKQMMLIDLGANGFSADHEKIGGVHESLNGTRTHDVTNVKGRWRIRLRGLDPGALTWFEMAYRGALGSPLYFTDLQRVNFMTAPSSSAGSAWSPPGTVHYTLTNGTIAQNPITVAMLPATVDGAAVQVPAPQRSWVWGTTAAGQLRLGEMIPVRPGEQITFSIYVTSGAPNVHIVPYAMDLTEGALAGSATTTILGTPRRLWTTYTVPATGVHAIRPLMSHASNQFTAFTAAQVERSSAPTPWALGAGAPKVLMPSFPLDRHAIGRYADADLQLMEV